MTLRPKNAGALFMLAVVASLLLAACSSSSPRDQNYGNDTAVGFIPPDGGSGPDVTTGTNEVSPEVAQAADGGIGPESSDDSASDEGD